MIALIHVGHKGFSHLRSSGDAFRGYADKILHLDPLIPG